MKLEIEERKMLEGEYGAMGYCIGGIAGASRIAIDGLQDKLSLQQFKHLLSPLPVSGACTLCHIVGTTPEAPTLDSALMGNKPRAVHTIGPEEVGNQQPGMAAFNNASRRPSPGNGNKNDH